MTHASGNWLLRHSAVVHDRFVRIRSDTYTLPNGRAADWEIIDSADSVFVIALVDEGRSAVVFNQFRPGPARILAELPGGYIDADEPIEAAGVRELLEETGYLAADTVYAGWEWTDARSTRKKHAVIAWNSVWNGAPARDSLETGSIDIVNAAAFLDLLLSGALTDAGAAVRAIIWAAKTEVGESLHHRAVNAWARSLLTGCLGTS